MTRHDKPKTAVTVGTFDGLHKGHRKVLTTLKEEASKRGLRPVVFTFDRHPLETVAPHRAPAFVQSPSQRNNELWSQGLELKVLEFTPDNAALTASQWMRRLKDVHDTLLLVVGYDNTFGCDGVGLSIEDFVDIGRELGIEVISAPIERGISSSAIRHLLSSGKIEEANSMLGRPFEITGKVVHGEALGRSLGFPTANIHIPYRAHLPMKGVYVADALTPDGKVFRSVVNVGRRPTVSDSERLSVEAHLIGFEGDLYDRRLTLRFRKFLRCEKKFDSIEDLKDGIRKDVEAVKNADTPN